MASASPRAVTDAIGHRQLKPDSNLVSFRHVSSRLRRRRTWKKKKTMRRGWESDCGKTSAFRPKTKSKTNGTNDENVREGREEEVKAVLVAIPRLHQDSTLENWKDKLQRSDKMLSLKNYGSSSEDSSRFGYLPAQ